MKINPDPNKLSDLKNKYRGQRAFIMGNGPSLTRLDLSHLKTEYTFGVNSIFYLFDEIGFKPSFYVVEDTLVAEDRAEEINRLEGMVKIFGTYLDYCIEDRDDILWANVLFDYSDYANFPHFSRDASQCIWVGGTVSYMCMQLAYMMGFDPVYLIGFDHSYDIPEDADLEGTILTSNSQDPNHFHPDYFGKGKRWHLPQVERMELSYRKARRVFEQTGRRIFNATAGGELEVFDRVEYSSLFPAPVQKSGSAVPTEKKLDSPSTTSAGENLPEITAVVCTHNNQNQLVNTLESLLVQSLPAERYEVIVVDNASSDDTEAVCATYPQFRCIHEDETGLSHARNAGIAAARSSLIAFIDDDAEADPLWLESILRVFQSNPDIWAAGGKVLPIWDAPRPDWLTEQHYRSLSLVEWGPEQRELKWPERVIGTNCAFRKEVFDSIGLFQTDLGRVGKVLLGNEDTEIQERIHANGKLVVYSPNAVVHHHVPAERMTREYLQRRDEGTIISRQVLKLRSEGRLDEAAATAHEFVRSRTLRDMQDVVQTKLEQTAQQIKAFRNRHLGQRCVIIGNGPSLNNMDLSFLKNEITFATNRIYLGFEKFDFTPDYYLSVNPLVLEQSMDEIVKIPAPKFLSVHGIPHAPLEESDFYFLQSMDQPIFSRNPGQGIWEGYTVTYVALELAHYMGFEEVYLIGCDHSFATRGPANAEVTSEGDDPNHFTANYFGKGTRWHLPDLTNSEIAYRLAREVYEADGRKVFDATLNGKLTVFPKVEYSTIFLEDSKSSQEKELPGTVTDEKNLAEEPVTSILVPVDDWKTITPDFLETIRHQTISDKLETIFISTGEEEGPLHRFQEIQSILPHSHHLNLEGGSLIQAANTGLLEAAGEYIMILLPGDRLQKEALESLTKTLQANPDAGCAYADWEFVHAPAEEDTQPVIYRSPEFHPMLALLLNPLSPHTLYRRNVLLEDGIFDSRYSLSSDYDLLLRMVVEGQRAAHIPETLSSCSTPWMKEPLLSQLRYEMAQIRKRYIPSFTTEKLLPEGLSSTAAAQAWAAVGWHSAVHNSHQHKMPAPDIEFAAHCCSQSLQLYLSYEAVHNLTAALGQLQQWETAENILANMNFPQFDQIKRTVAQKQLLQMMEVPLPESIPFPAASQSPEPAAAAKAPTEINHEKASEVDIARQIQKFTGSKLPIPEDRIQDAAAVLHAILTSPDPAGAVSENLDSLDSVLMALLEINIEQACSDGKSDLAQGLSNLKGHIHLQIQNSERQRKPPAQPEYLVSAIVSTYNASRFIRGCLEDLVQQSIADKLEIIVVDTGSEENEGEIVREFQSEYDNIVYIRTEDRETIYSAWNRGIRAARGKYITNANTDDRHHPRAFERLAGVLDENPDIGVAYADSAITSRPNSTLSDGPVSGRFRWPDFNRRLLFQVCIIGPQPMWRKSIHERYGCFDPEYKSAGDYEFWLRISDEVRFKHLPEILGLYYESNQSVEHLDPHLAIQESELARERHWNPQDGPRPQPSGYFLERYDHFPPGQDSTDLPLVSVIIPTYNRPQKLEKTLQSIANQSYPAVEAVVINDAGDDVSSVIAHFEADLNIQHISLEENGGAGAARNAGLRAASGQFIAFLDDDDTFHPIHILALLSELTARPDCVGAYSDAFQVNAQAPNAEALETRKVVYSFDYSPERMLVHNYIPILCLMIRRSTLDQAGLFDESLEAVEDWEWLIRVTGTGELVHLPFVTAQYAHASEEKTRNTQNLERVQDLYKKIYSIHQARVTENILQDRSTFYRSLTGSSLEHDAPDLFSPAGIKPETDASLQRHIIHKAEILDPQVDIVIPIYGQASLVKNCVESVLDTTNDAHLILVDDCSPGKEIQQLFASWKGHPRITLARTPGNAGFIGATRLGASLGTAPYILHLNSDTEAINSGWLGHLIPDDDDIAVTGAKLLFPPSAPGLFAGTIQHAGVARNHLGAPYHPHLGHPADKPEANIPLDVNAVTGGCMLIRRTIWEELGGWHPVFNKGVFEDVDFCWRVRAKGLRVRYIPSACLYHYESASGSSDGEHPLHVHSDRNLGVLKRMWPEIESDEDIFFPAEKVARWKEAITLIKKAEIAMQNSSMEAALEIMGRAVDTAPDHPTSLVNYAQLLMKKGMYEQAQDILTRTVDLAPDMWSARYLLVGTLLGNEEFQNAWKQIRILEESFPDAPEVTQYRNLALKYRPDLENLTPPPESGAEAFLNEILASTNIPELLEARKDELDHNLLNLVHEYIDAAVQEGNPEVETAMRNLSAYIENAMAGEADPPAFLSPPQLLHAILDAEDTENALIQAEPHFDSDFIEYLEAQAESAQVAPMRTMYKNLAQYVGEVIMNRTTSPKPHLEGIPIENNDSNSGPIVVYQMGKVGSSSIVASIQQAGLQNPLYQVHYLTQRGIGRVTRANDHAPEPFHIRQSRELRSMLDHGKNRLKWLVITPVRDPVARNLSAFFENIFRWVPDFNPRENHSSASIAKLQEIFMEQYPHHVPVTWFEEEFIPSMQINPYSFQFPKKDGFQVLHTASADILLIKLEMIDQIARPVLSQFLSAPDFNLCKSNHADHKSYADPYQHFKNTISLPEEYLERMYSSAYSRHFYSRDEIESFMRQWSRK